MHCVQAPSKLLFWGFQNRPTLLIWRGYLEPCFYYLYTVFNAVTTLRESVKTINCCFGFYNVGYASKIPYAPAVNILKLMFTVFVLLGPYVCCAWHSESRLRGIRVKATVRVLALQIQKKNFNNFCGRILLAKHFRRHIANNWGQVPGATTLPIPVLCVSWNEIPSSSACTLIWNEKGLGIVGRFKNKFLVYKCHLKDHRMGDLELRWLLKHTLN